jgi:hypothetical protein
MMKTGKQGCRCEARLYNSSEIEFERTLAMVALPPEVLGDSVFVFSWLLGGTTLMRRIYAALAVLVTCAQAPAAFPLPGAQTAASSAQEQPAANEATQEQSKSKPQSTKPSQQDAQQSDEQQDEEAQESDQPTYYPQPVYVFHPRFGWAYYYPAYYPQQPTYAPALQSYNSYYYPPAAQSYNSYYYSPPAAPSYQNYQYYQPQAYGGGSNFQCRT